MKTIALIVSWHLNAGDLLVGFGTLALAWFTWRLARTTADSATTSERTATAAERSAEAALRSLDAIGMPFVIAVPTPYEAILLGDHELPQWGVAPPACIHRASRGGGWFVRMRLMNIGSGPAVVIGVGLSRADDADFLDRIAEHVPIAPGQTSDIEVSSSAWPSTPRTATLQLEYAHANGGIYTTTSEVNIDRDLMWCRTYVQVGRSAPHDRLAVGEASSGAPS